MTSRQRQIVKQILEVLYRLDGGQLGEVTLHAEVSLSVTPNPSYSEFMDALKHCDESGWLVGVLPQFGGHKLWQINDAGNGARLKMR